MQKGKFRHLPVVAGSGEVVGVLSDRDLRNVLVFFDKKPGKPGDVMAVAPVKVRDVMTKDPITITPETEVAEAAEMLATKAFGCLPVIEQGKLAGIVTEVDLLRLLAKMLKET
jgi:CBS domain-containing membrane protein